MSTNSPVTVGTRGGSVEERPVTHRTKHRKEVKRYYQRQQNKRLREEAKARDAQLFLFDHNASTNGAADAESAVAVVAGEEDAVISVVAKDLGGVAPTTATAAPQASQVAAPLPVLTANANWGFDFVLRKTSATAATAAAEDKTPTSASAGQGLSDAAHQALVPTGTRSLATSPFLPNSPLSLVAAARRKPQRDLTETPASGDDTAKPRRHAGGSSKPISVLPIDTAVTGSITKLLNNAHVQRVEGVPAIPMEAPLPTGTDLNRPPRTYLTLDPVYNIHQHAPGFVRDQGVALQHMLATAIANWKDMQLNALIVTSAEAMQTIFEQVYVPSRPLALRVRRIGPTIIIDSQASQPSQVYERREQALFSKALYLMKETHGRDVPTAGETVSTAQMALTLPERRLSSVTASDPFHFGAALHRYSQLLRWHIDSTELLVGNDAPVVLDQRTSTEQLVRVKAADQTDSVDSEQRETLMCWFNAMLANVSYVGTYLHCDGTLLSYNVKKTNDLLGYMEARMAGAALNFTSTTLQWVVKHCTRDGATYAIVRNFTDSLQLYELPDVDDTNTFMEEAERHFAASPAPADPQRQPHSRESPTPHIGSGTGGPYAGYPSNAPHLSRFSLNFGRTCFHIGQHLYREGGVGRANDALTLLHRSLRLFLPCCLTEAVAREMVVGVVQMLPVLVSRKIQADANAKAAAAANGSGANPNAGGACNKSSDRDLSCWTQETTPAGFVTASCSSPELYRDALVLCGRFEIPLRHAFKEAGGSDGDALMQAFYARCLVASSAGVCTVVAASLEAYYCGCHHLRVMRKARSEAKSKDNKGGNCTSTNTPALRGVDLRDDVMAALASMIQDLLQVVVEGLVRLEETSALISPLHAVGAPATTATLTTTVSMNPRAAANPPATTAPPNTAEGWTTPVSALQTCVTTASSSTGGRAADNTKQITVAREELSSAGHSSSSASSESVLSATYSVGGEADNDTAAHPSHSCMRHRKRTSSPARVAVAATQNSNIAVEDGAVKLTTCGTVLDPRTQVDTTPLRSALCELYGDIVRIAMADTASGFTTRALAELGSRLEARAQEQAGRLPTTPLWLTSLKADVVSLSFTALRFYNRVAPHTRRHLLKLAQVYYLVGKEHHRTARYTKALEALHRAKSLLQASHKAPADVVFGEAFGSHGLLQWADVMLLLGDVYRSVVERKLEMALGVAVCTMAQPLLVGPLHNLPEEADTFFAQSLNAYKQGGQDDGCTAAKSCTLLVYASVLMERIALTGEPASRADSQRIAGLLRESEVLTPTLCVEEREWQIMRLFTVTGATAADSALTRSAEEIVLRCDSLHGQMQRSGNGSSATGADANTQDMQKQMQWVDADVVDCSFQRRERLAAPPTCSKLAQLQKALVCCVMVERLAPPAATAPPPSSASSVPLSSSVRSRDTSENKYRSLLRWVGRAAAFLTTVIQFFVKEKDVWRTAAARHQWMSTLRTWGEQTVGSCLHRTVCMVALRLLNAAQSQLPNPKQAEAREAFRLVTMRLEEGSKTSGDSDEAHELIVKSLKELETILSPFVEW